MPCDVCRRTRTERIRIWSKKISINITTIKATVDDVEQTVSDLDSFSVALNSITSKIEIKLNQIVSLIGTPIVKFLSGTTWVDYANVALKTGDASTVVVTPIGSNGTAGIAGEFSFKFAAGGIKGAETGALNEEETATLTVTE